jgi:protein-tyrosine sulfotransferase
LHPDCGQAWPDEDWLLSESWALTDYADAMGERWRRDPAWYAYPEVGARLLRHLGGGLVSFLSERAAGKRIVSKTPSVSNLDRFFALFPDAYLLILVRDGRSVVESTVKSMGDHRGQVARRWAAAAYCILEFDRENRDHAHRYRIVRYEDLVRDPAGKMTEILGFLGLDVERYDFSAIARLPVLGSSFTPNPEGRWKWKIAPPTGDEGFIERWRDWSRFQHERFNRIAGDALERLGYQPVWFTRNRLPWRMITTVGAAAELPRRAAQWLRRRGER